MTLDPCNPCFYENCVSKCYVRFTQERLQEARDFVMINARLSGNGQSGGEMEDAASVLESVSEHAGPSSAASRCPATDAQQQHRVIPTRKAIGFDWRRKNLLLRGPRPAESRPFFVCRITKPHGFPEPPQYNQNHTAKRWARCSRAAHFFICRFLVRWVALGVSAIAHGNSSPGQTPLPQIAYS